MATLKVLLLRRVRGLPLHEILVHHTRCVGLQLDAQTVLDYVHAHPQLAKTTQMVWRLFSFVSGAFVDQITLCSSSMANQSIGGADLAYRNSQAERKLRLSPHLHATYLLVTTTQITAFIVDKTSVSLPRVIPSAMPWLGPSSFLCHQKWESYLKVRFQTLPFGCGVNQADAEAHDRHPNSR